MKSVVLNEESYNDEFPYCSNCFTTKSLKVLVVLLRFANIIPAAHASSIIVIAKSNKN